MKPSLFILKYSIIICIWFPLLLICQGENRFWYFGQKAGLDFSNSPPSSLTNGQELANEGCVTVSDPAGNLLFYTSGDTIWNKQHQIMANGTGIISGNSNTQNACVIKSPSTNNQYYLFTLSNGNSSFIDTLYYSVIDMVLAAGNGSVISKNVFLKGGCDQKICVSEHCNRKDAWLIVHQSATANFLSFLISTSGVSNTPVISPSGILGNVIGQMKIASTGRKLAMANGTMLPKLILYDFNNQSGLISNSLALTVNTSTSSSAYGCEFSPDASKLYCTDYGFAQMNSGIYEWNLCVGNNSAIVNSIQSYTTAAFLRFLGMQLANDGKIYIANNSYSLDVISQPNLSMPLNGISLNNLYLGGRKANWGLPNMIITKKQIPYVLTYSVSPAPGCNTYTFFSLNTSSSCLGANYTGLSWNFNDPLSGAANTSSLNNPVHNFSSGGTYTVMLLLQTPCTTDTLRQQVVVNSPALLISGNATVCPFQSSSFTVTGANSYTWSNNAQGNVMSFSPSVTTQYTVSGSNTLTGCVSSKTFSVIVNKCAQVMSSTENENGIALFPNPSHNELFFSTNSTDLVILVFYNQLGEEIFRESNYQNMKPIDIRALSPDLYYYRVLTNQKTYHGKFVKE